MKWFNVKGQCVPAKHYMVDISSRLEEMKRLVEKEEYFIINRARQYGKTTTLSLLRQLLVSEYTVISLSFQKLGNASFKNEETFCRKFLENIDISLKQVSKSTDFDPWKNDQVTDLDLLSRHITTMCEGKKVILMIDEVDKASNHQVFLGFLGILRAKYIDRADGLDFTFHSVILAGVYDIKNIKLKMIEKGIYQQASEEVSYDSPWNIAEDYDEEMSFSTTDIAGMLTTYEEDHQTGMDIDDIAEEIYSLTSGYPFLVSRICQYIDEKLAKNWTMAGISEAVKLITEEPKPNTLFDDLFKNIRNHQSLSDFLYMILMEGEVYQFTQGDEVIEQGLRYAFIRIVNQFIRIHNKIFEITITAYFITKERREGKKLVKNNIEADVVNGEKFNIELFFKKFNTHYQKHYSKRDKDFIEREAAFLFLCFLQPYLNGKGFFQLESKPNFATGKRMDIIITYGKEEFIIELKIWRGEKRHQGAYRQLTDYIKKRDAEKGYLLTFDFRQKKEIKQEWIEVHGTRILDVQV